MKNKKVLLLCETALMTALMCVCAWITVPLPAVPVTLQTFAVFFALLFLGGKWGTVSVALYLSLGALGLPVFSGMRGGFGILFGSTGGYLFGFLFAGVLFLVFENLLKTNLGKILLCA
ncbi:MAG: biotin transporter BioY, partial [Clostridia bacterium]|nr:biotin transporter BioY [Clostridia bacterium]